MRGVAAYDPEGDHHENDQLAADATDGNAATSWRTERYRTFYKHGVGLVLQAGRRALATTAAITTDTPGFQAEIEAGPSPQGPFQPVSQPTTIAASTLFRLTPTRAPYLVVWITHIAPDQAVDVSEVRVRGRR